MTAAPSADRLRIKPWERAALLEIAEALRAPGAALDMRSYRTCIGALVAAVGRRSGELPDGTLDTFYASSWRSAALRSLYAPGSHDLALIYGHVGWGAGPLQAARAIEGFLAGEGNRCWDFMVEVAHG